MLPLLNKDRNKSIDFNFKLMNAMKYFLSKSYYKDNLYTITIWALEYDF